MGTSHSMKQSRQDLTKPVLEYPFNIKQVKSGVSRGRGLNAMPAPAHCSLRSTHVIYRHSDTLTLFEVLAITPVKSTSIDHDLHYVTCSTKVETSGKRVRLCRGLKGTLNMGILCEDLSSLRPAGRLFYSLGFMMRYNRLSEAQDSGLRIDHESWEWDGALPVSAAAHRRLRTNSKGHHGPINSLGELHFTACNCYIVIGRQLKQFSVSERTI
ncbi:hypothetical protein RRG08_007665 [Elysia crispata]|uniref:Uncharacterized protein n=1 Tax=Elysia crispata TaxID=231223 RepID=A0AAE0Y4S1_9GAST|nr:hypothetical protein RRG08_007665 [Elysia crispata]